MDEKELLKKYEPAKKSDTIVADPQVRAARFSPCGKVLVAGGYEGRVRRWDFAEPDMAELPSLHGHHAWIDGIAFRAEGSLLVTGDSWGQLTCWSDYAAEQPAVKWRHEQAHDGWIRAAAVSPDGQLVASCGSDKAVRVWSIEDGEKRREIAADQDVLQIRWLPDGTLLTGDDRGFVKQWRTDGTLVRSFDVSILFTLSRLQDVGGVHSLAIDSEGKLLAAGGVVPKNGGTVTGIPTVLLFDIATGEQRARLELGVVNDCYVSDLHFHADGFLSVTTYGTPGTGQLLYVKLDEKAPFFTKKLPNAHSLSWHPDGRRLAVVTTSAGSNGNGRPLDKDGNYRRNQSPIHIFRIEGKAAAG
jgi:WD40 repeat protein